MTKNKILLVFVLLVFVIGLIAAIVLVKNQQDLRDRAQEQVTYSLSENSLVIQYKDFNESVLDVNVRYSDGTTQNFHEQFNTPIGTQTKSLQLKNTCVVWIQVHGTNYHYESNCQTSPTSTPTQSLTPTIPTTTYTLTPTQQGTLTPTSKLTNTSTPSVTQSSTVTISTTPTPSQTKTPTATISLITTSTPMNMPLTDNSPTPNPETLPDAGVGAPLIMLSSIGTIVMIIAIGLLAL